MPDQVNPAFSLDRFSEAETDEEFGILEIKEHFADDLTPAVLRDWTARDFASIYVRFRPHLERHARRFLVNPSQVEEVVQDAFLYLMTTLPELDSELGVLKFLKWKVRLLSLDVIRANSRASISPLEELPDIQSEEPETSQGLERAHDAAIVSMALAKLQPRQREALIATLYEEKSTEVVASQMGLSENAFRQLLFRARSSFKKALVGEANTSGMSAAEILSVAARKAAQDSGKIISAAGAALLVLAVSIGLLPSLGIVLDEEPSQPAPQALPLQANPTPTQEPPVEAAGKAEVNLSVEVNAAEGLQLSSSPPPSEGRKTLDDSSDKATFALAVNDANGVQEPDLEELEFARVIFEEQVSAFSLDQFQLYLDAATLEVETKSEVDLILEGRSEDIFFSIGVTEAEPFVAQSAFFIVSTPRMKLFMAPTQMAGQLTELENGSISVEFVATDFLVGDADGSLLGVTSIHTNQWSFVLRMALVVSKDGEVISTQLSASSRS